MFAKSRYILVAGMLLLAPSWAVAEEIATAEEVIQKTQEAADYLAKNKEAGIDVFKTMKSPFVWKATDTLLCSTAPLESSSLIRPAQMLTG